MCERFLKEKEEEGGRPISGRSIVALAYLLSVTLVSPDYG